MLNLTHTLDKIYLDRYFISSMPSGMLFHVVRCCVRFCYVTLLVTVLIQTYSCIKDGAEVFQTHKVIDKNCDPFFRGGGGGGGGAIKLEE